MTLAAGTRLGAYDVLALIGAGGMGEVYQARDPRLSRHVAIKVLPPAFSADPERLQRFEQEAQAAAALNHPNILAVYDIGTHDGAPYIVSELLEGETLRERLTSGSLPVRKAVEYAVQIAHGLAAAHEKGIVHRDLKPENIFVTADGRVKILDFGLAKLTQADPALTGLSALPTTPPDTLPGVVLGTIGYMSPEQVRGLQADHRSDIFAFGAVLYEMLSGQRAFRGETTIDAMTAILKEDPPDLPVAERHIPPALARIVDRCLEKSPAARFQSTRDLAFALEGLSSQSESATAIRAIPVRRSYARVGWSMAALSSVALLAALPLAVAHLREPTIEPSAIRFPVAPPEDATFTGGGANAPGPAVSPDGRRMVFRAQRTGSADLLWVRSFDALEAQPLPGTEGGDSPFWSPDSRFLGFFADGKLKKIEFSGGPVQTLCDAPAGRGGTWNSQGIIVFAASATAGLWRVSAAGGEPAALTTLDASNKETSHRSPQFLPDGRRFLFLAQPGNSVRLGSLDSPETRSLLSTDTKALYAAPGYLLFVREQTLMAQPFDPSRAELRGDPFPVAEKVTVISTNGRADFSVSESGVLTYRSGLASVPTQLTWFDRSGKNVGDVGDVAPYIAFDLSVDGRYIVAQGREPTGSFSAWVVDIARGVATRALSSTRVPGDLVWAPDVPRFAYLVNGTTMVIEQPAFGGPERIIGDYPGLLGIEDWSRDGRYLAMEVREGDRSRGLVAPVDGGKPTVVVESAALLDEFHFSPDGRLIAYNSDESGRHEVYLAPLPRTGERWQVSTGGGVQGRWRGDGRELYYLALDGSMMAVQIGPGSPPQIGTPKALFKTGLLPTYNIDHYGVTGDGQRFLVKLPVRNREQPPITVVTNWTAGLRK